MGVGQQQSCDEYLDTEIASTNWGLASTNQDTQTRFTSHDKLQTRYSPTEPRALKVPQCNNPD